MNLQFIYIHNSPIFRKTFILSLLIACINIKSRLNQILKNKQNLPVIEIGAKKSFSLKKKRPIQKNQSLPELWIAPSYFRLFFTRLRIMI